jgi:hypothetical protein
MKTEPLIPDHGDYNELESFQIVRLVYDVTVRFCNRYIEKRSKIHDQMIQTARSSVQNIAERIQASSISTTTEFKLTSLARGGLEELRLDYENFLHQHNLRVWPSDDRRRKSLIARKCSTVIEVSLWILQEQKRLPARQPHSPPSMPSMPEITANAALTLTIIACNFLNRQIHILRKRIKSESIFIERRYRIRSTALLEN